MTKLTKYLPIALLAGAFGASGLVPALTAMRSVPADYLSRPTPWTGTQANSARHSLTAVNYYFAHPLPYTGTPANNAQHGLAV